MDIQPGLTVAGIGVGMGYFEPFRLALAAPADPKLAASRVDRILVGSPRMP